MNPSDPTNPNQQPDQNPGNPPQAPSQNFQPTMPQPVQPTVPTQPIQPGQPVISSPKKGGGFKKFLLILLALIFIGGVAYGIYALTKKDPTDTSASTMSQKKDIDELSVGVVSGAIALYPKSTSDSYAQSVSQQIYEGLVAYEDQTKIVPRLATGWSNPDDSTWDFNLRKGVTFHNGHVMKAADVVASLKAAKENSDLSLYNDTLSDIKALNDYKVEIKTTKPDPFLLNKLTFLMILDSTDIDGTDTRNATGPYELKSGTTPTDTEIQLTAYDKYHGGHVYVKQLNIIVEADEASASKDFKAGKINLVGEYATSNPDQLKGVDFQKVVVDDPSVTLMTINSLAAGPLQNLKVRQALQYAIDKSALITNAGVDAEPASQLVTKAIPGYNPDITTPKANITKAKQLLAEAGYPNGITINLETSSQIVTTANEVIKQAKEAGITINLVNAPSFDDLVNDLLAGKTQTAVLSYSSDLLDSSEVFDTVLRQTGNYKSDTLNQYLEESSQTVDQGKRLKELQAASKSIADDVAAIPLYNRHRTWLMDKSYAIQFDMVSPDPGIYFYKVYLTN